MGEETLSVSMAGVFVGGAEGAQGVEGVKRLFANLRWGQKKTGTSYGYDVPVLMNRGMVDYSILRSAPILVAEVTGGAI